METTITAANFGTVGAGIAVLWLAARFVRATWPTISGARLLLVLAVVALAWAMLATLLVYQGDWPARLLQGLVAFFTVMAGQTWAYEAVKQGTQAAQGE